jgi:hypothetical protein
MSGDSSLLREWRAGLPRGNAIESATAARLRTTTRAMDPHPRQTAAVTRVTLAVFDGLVTADGGHWFRGGKLRTILEAAAQLHAIDIDGRQTSRHKSSRNFLRAAPVPPGWKPGIVCAAWPECCASRAACVVVA